MNVLEGVPVEVQVRVCVHVRVGEGLCVSVKVFDGEAVPVFVTVKVKEDVGVEV